MRKILINLEVVPFRKLAFLCVFFLLVLRLELILQQDLCLLRICFALFVVNNAHREFRHANTSSDFAQFLEMNFYDATPYFQEEGGVTNPLISYKLKNISSRYLVSHHFSTLFQLTNDSHHSICYSSQFINPS